MRSRGWLRVGRVGRHGGVLLAAIAALAAAGGVAYATIPDSGGVIQGCYLKAIGSLRLIDPSSGQHCTAVEKPIQWNQTGPRGAGGPQGPVGTAGKDGSSPDTYWTYQRLSVPIPDNQLPGTQGDPAVVTLTNLPPGNYLVNASTNLATADHTILSCRTGNPDSNSLVGGSGVEQVSVHGQPGDVVEQPLSVNGVASLPDGGSIALHCAANSFNVPPPPIETTNSFGGFIIATRVGALSGQ